MSESDTLLEFPCEFPIKVMGRSSADFELSMFELVRKHAPDLQREALRSRASAQGNYQSLTITIRATSKQQLDRIYLELNACDDVLMTL